MIDHYFFSVCVKKYKQMILFSIVSFIIIHAAIGTVAFVGIVLLLLHKILKKTSTKYYLFWERLCGRNIFLNAGSNLELNEVYPL